MTHDQVIEYFGSALKAHRELGVSRSTIYRWRDLFPVAAQLEVQRKTNGALKADLSEYQTEAA